MRKTLCLRGLALLGLILGATPVALAQLDKPHKPGASAAEIDFSKLARGRRAAPQRDPFGPRSFAPPAAPAAPKASRKVASAAPEKPSAPPLPFTYLGKVTQGKRTETYVLRGEELISIAPGQNIDAHYRVEAVTETAIRFTYLPLKTPQTLEVPEAGA